MPGIGNSDRAGIGAVVAEIIGLEVGDRREVAIARERHRLAASGGDCSREAVELRQGHRHRRVTSQGQVLDPGNGGAGDVGPVRHLDHIGTGAARQRAGIGQSLESDRVVAARARDILGTAGNGGRVGHSEDVLFDRRLRLEAVGGRRNCNDIGARRGDRGECVVLCLGHGDRRAAGEGQSLEAADHRTGNIGTVTELQDIGACAAAQRARCGQASGIDGVIAGAARYVLSGGPKREIGRRAERIVLDVGIAGDIAVTVRRGQRDLISSGAGDRTKAVMLRFGHGDGGTGIDGQVLDVGDGGSGNIGTVA